MAVSLVPKRFSLLKKDLNRSQGKLVKGRVRTPGKLCISTIDEITKNLSEKYLREETRHGKNGILNNPFHESASPCQRIPKNPKISIECQASYGSY